MYPSLSNRGLFLTWASYLGVSLVLASVFGKCMNVFVMFVDSCYEGRRARSGVVARQWPWSPSFLSLQ